MHFWYIYILLFISFISACFANISVQDKIVNIWTSISPTFRWIHVNTHPNFVLFDADHLLFHFYLPSKHARIPFPTYLLFIYTINISPLHEFAFLLFWFIYLFIQYSCFKSRILILLYTCYLIRYLPIISPY